MKIQKKQEIEFFGTKTGNANSIALGYATETKNFGEVAVGIMNKSTAAKDPNSPKGVCVDSDATLFSVGYGGSGERKNALEVKGDGSVMVSGKNGDINVADKIKQALDTDASIELVRSAENNLQYTLMVNDEPRGSIDIPKDQFLKNVTYDSEGKQLVFTFVTLDEDEHVEKVPVGDLKDIYKAGDGITINDDNVISADFSSVMTAISDEKTQRETTDNEIKSTLDTKADTSAIPTKVSQLTNDSGYLTHHQSLSEYAKKANVWETDSRGDIVFNVTETDEDSGTYTGKYTFSKDGGFSVQSKWSLDDTTTDYSFDRYGFLANWICGNKIEYSNRKYTTINCDRGIINLKDFVISVADAESSSTRGVILPIKTFGGVTYYTEIPYATQSSNGTMSAADKVKLDGIQDLIDAKANKDDVLQINHPSDQADQVTFGDFHLICSKATNSTTLSFGEEHLTREDFAKINELPSITGKLSNITVATTTEDMITKFNDLLADLKARGYMAANVTA